MAYVKANPPSVVYHLTRMENLDSILDDGKISRFLDSECWFCESLGKMKAYINCTHPHFHIGLHHTVPEEKQSKSAAH